MKPITKSGLTALLITECFILICLGVLGGDTKSPHVSCGWPFPYAFVPAGHTAFFSWRAGQINVSLFLADLGTAILAGLVVFGMLRLYYQRTGRLP